MDSKKIIGNAIEEVLDEEFAEYMKALPIYSDHKFSERHNRKMNRLIKRQRKPYFRFICTTGRRVACIIVAFIVMSASALSVRAIREAFFDFIMSIFSDHNVITVESGTDSDYPETIEEEYYISDLPDEFKENDYLKSNASIDHFYSINDKYIVFSQHTKSDFEIYVDNENTQFTEIEESGTIYMMMINDYDITYIWDNGRYIFEIESNLDKNIILNLCKSTKVKK